MRFTSTIGFAYIRARSRSQSLSDPKTGTGIDRCRWPEPTALTIVKSISRSNKIKKTTD